MKRIVVIGLGSMGKRRIRLILNLLPNSEVIGIDLRETCRSQAQSEFQIKTFAALDQLDGIFDAGFVCTAPQSHEDIIVALLQRGMHVFTEINLVHISYDKIFPLMKKQDKIVFLSSTPMYRCEIQYLKEAVSRTTLPLSYCYHIGQYLPDWHPWDGPKDFFAFDKAVNGCREIFAIQLPWMLHVFGDVQQKQIMVSRQKISSLDIDFNDSYQVLIQHSNGNRGVLIVDVVARKAINSLQIVSDELQILWDGTTTGFYELDFENKQYRAVKHYQTSIQDNRYSTNIIEDAYEAEILQFFDVAAGNANALYTVEREIEVLHLIDCIESRTKE